MKKILIFIFLLIALAGFSQNRTINLDEGCYISNDTLYCGYDTLVGVSALIVDGKETGQLLYWNVTAGKYDTIPYSQAHWNSTNGSLVTDSIMTRRISFAGDGGNEYITQSGGVLYLGTGGGNKLNVGASVTLSSNSLFPAGSNSLSLGGSTYIWKDAYFRRQYILGQKTSNDLFLATNENSGLIGDSAVVISKEGNIGLGSAPFGNKIYIEALTTQPISINSPTGDRGLILSLVTGSTKGSLKVNTTNSYYYWDASPSNYNFNFLLGSGNLGIGTTTPTAKLTIDGNKTSSNLFEAINDNNGLLGDSSVYIDAKGNVKASGSGSFSVGVFGNVILGNGINMLYNTASSNGVLYYTAANNWDFKNMTFGVVNPKTSYNLAEFINDADGNIGDSSVVISSIGGIFSSGIFDCSKYGRFDAGYSGSATGEIAIGGSEITQISGNGNINFIVGSTTIATATATSGTNVFTVANNLTVADSATIGGLLIKSTTATITASVTQSQGQQPLTTNINEVSTVGNANDVVTLPTASAGLEIFIINNGANTLQIFPASGDDLGAGVNTSTTLGTGENITFVSYNDTNWEIK